MNGLVTRSCSATPAHACASAWRSARDAARCAAARRRCSSASARLAAVGLRSEVQHGVPPVSKGYRFTDLIIAFLGGAATGAVIAILTAPRSGAETRKRIRDLLYHSADEASRLPHALREATTAAAHAFGEALHVEAPAQQAH